MKPKVRIGLKITEFIACIACLATKIYTDYEADQINHLNRKLSREWGLLNNITWSKAGDAFANVTIGGYTLITALMVITRCIDSKSHPTVMEKIFLVFGLLLFFALGGLIVASIDKVPDGLFDNVFILSGLSFLVGILFLIDVADPLRNSSHHHTQTENTQIRDQMHAIRQKIEMNDVDNKKELIPPLSSSDIVDAINSRSSTMRATAEIQKVPRESNDYNQNIEIVQTTNLPQRQSPVFEKVFAGPEKSRPIKQLIPISYVEQKNRWEDSSRKIQPPIYNQPNRSSQHIHENRGFLSEQNSYVKGPVVDDANFIYKNRAMNDQICCRDKHKEPTTPITPGYVANAAKMWERRTKARRTRTPSPKSQIAIYGLQTNV